MSNNAIMDMDVSVVNSCRVCTSSNQDDEFESLFTPSDNGEISLSLSGALYEELINIQIDMNSVHVYPQFLCHSCMLQIKLFKKLKERALKTLDALRQFKIETSLQVLCKKKEEERIAEHPQAECEMEVYMLQNEETYDNEDEEGSAFDSSDAFTDVHYLEEADNDSVSSQSYEQPRRQKKKKSDVQKLHECYSCNEFFSSRSEFLQHRQEVHQNQYQCPDCPKLLRTSDALRVHLKLHRGEQSFKCEICSRSFNQKVHLKYHMDKHNNVRRFKCEQCDKAFLSKADLGIHMRTHTGDRRYNCDICGRGFLLLQHLKMHSYSHTADKSFECDLCQRKFVSPSTLRMHIQTMHFEDTPRFSCEFCSKKFRRKHRLNSHYKVHEKQLTGIMCQEVVVSEDVELQTRLSEEAVDNEFVEHKGQTLHDLVEEAVDRCEFVDETAFVPQIDFIELDERATEEFLFEDT